MRCPPGGDPVTWATWAAHANAIDAAGTSLQIQGYSRLTDSQEYPFRFPGTIPVIVGVEFRLQPERDGWTVIQSNTLVKWPAEYHIDGHFTPWKHPGGTDDHRTLLNLAEDMDQELFLITEDDCWCPTAFKLRAGTADTLFIDEGVDFMERKIGGCQHIQPIPMGTFIPKSAAKRRQTIKHSWFQAQSMTIEELRLQAADLSGEDLADIQQRDKVQTCANMIDGTWLILERVSNKFRVTKVVRRVRGYLTWRISYKQFVAMTDAMNNIATGSCGSDGTFYKAGYRCSGPGSVKLVDNCPVDLDSLIWTVACESPEEGLHNCTGAIGVEGDFNLGCGSHTINYPWATDVNGAEECGTAWKRGYMVYRSIDNHFGEIINRLQNLLPSSPGGCNCPKCTVTYYSETHVNCACATVHAFSEDTPKKWEADSAVEAGKYECGKFAISIGVSPDSFGLTSGKCDVIIHTDCRPDPERCADKECQGCGRGCKGETPDFGKVSFALTGCEGPGPTLGTDFTLAVDFVSECCGGMVGCPCNANDEKNPV